jgi:hypothetical protein
MARIDPQIVVDRPLAGLGEQFKFLRLAVGVLLPW